MLRAWIRARDLFSEAFFVVSFVLFFWIRPFSSLFNSLESQACLWDRLLMGPLKSAKFTPGNVKRFRDGVNGRPDKGATIYLIPETFNIY